MFVIARIQSSSRACFFLPSARFFLSIFEMLDDIVNESVAIVYSVQQGRPLFGSPPSSWYQQSSQLVIVVNASHAKSTLVIIPYGLRTFPKASPKASSGNLSISP